jgi:hypothetical protein
LTAAARGGLRPPPARRPRRTTRPPGPAPPSLAQHRIQRLGLLHPASFNVRVRTLRPIPRATAGPGVPTTLWPGGGRCIGTTRVQDAIAGGLLSATDRAPRRHGPTRR